MHLISTQAFRLAILAPATTRFYPVALATLDVSPLFSDTYDQTAKSERHSTFDLAFLQLVQALGVTNLGARRLFPPPLLASSPLPLLDSPAVVPRVESRRNDGSELVASERREEGEVLMIHDRDVNVEAGCICGLFIE